MWTLCAVTARARLRNGEKNGEERLIETSKTRLGGVCLD